MEYFDQHVHSNFSFDSDQPEREYLEIASKLGITYFVTTNHFDLNYLNQRNNDISFDIQKEKESKINLQKEFSNIKILQGIEFGYTKYNYERINKIIKENDFDIINLSVHENGVLDYYYPEGFIEFGIKETLLDYFENILKSMEFVIDFDVLCHIDFGFKTAYLVDKSIKFSDYEKQITAILKRCIDLDKCLEINTKVQEFLPEEHTIYLLTLYKKLGGINLTLSSDAHNVKRFRSSFEHCFKIIKDVGFDHLNYFVKRKRYELKLK